MHVIGRLIEVVFGCSIGVVLAYWVGVFGVVLVWLCTGCVCRAG